MKPENIKLLDLQTGNYLELGKDFYYGCNTIMLHCYTKEELTEYQQRDDYNPHYLIYDTDYNNPEKYHKIIHNGFQEAIDRDTATVRLFTEHKSEPQGILKTLCDKTGALVYGGRYVLLSQERADIYDVDCYHNDWSLRQYVKEYRTIGLMLKTHFIVGKNILKVADIKNIVESTYFEGMKDITVNDKFGYIDNGNAKFVIYYAKGNIFEEYSKQLRNEENKFDELMEKLK